MLSLEEFKNILDRVYEAQGRQYYLYANEDIEYPLLDSHVIRLLEIIFDDTEGWIDLWVNELECGAYGGADIWHNGKNVQLHTIEDLWNLLTVQN